jgi:inorganic triphosphatase YgiF
MKRAFHSPGRKASPTAGLERELKFAADPETFDAALALPLLGGLDGGPSRRLESVYFDTEDGDLARSGVALRVRRVDGACILGLKRAADSDHGMFERDEQEVESPSAEPDLALFDPETARDLAKIIGGKVLKAKFGSDVHRTAGMVELGDGTVEVALDSGFLFAGERRESLREIELELKSGAPAALFTYGLQVIEALPVRLCIESKAERARRLLSPEPPAPVRAHPPSLTPETPLDEAIGALLRNCLSHFLGNLPALESGDGVEAVHQMRVAMRRLRSALGLFIRLFPCADFEVLRSESRRIAAVLGVARDWDVFAETVRAGPLSRFVDEPGLDGFLRTAQAKADAGRAAVLRLAADKETTRFALVLERIAAERGWRSATADDRLRWLDEPVVGFAARSLDRLDRKVRKRGRHFPSLTPEKRHALRIALKHMRYSTEFFGRLFHPAAAELYARKAAALQDLLGELNDAAIALRLIKELDCRASPDLAYAAGVAAGWCSRASVGDEDALTKAWRSLVKAQRYWRSELAEHQPESE